VSHPFWPYPLDPDHPRNDLEARFWAVHAVTPQVYETIDAFAKSLLSSGRSRYGVDAFFNAIRWDSGLGMDGEPFKMNDHYRPYYARLWLQNNESYWGFFELRRVKGEFPEPPPHPPYSWDLDRGTLF
jgi:hypothetical protein